MPPRIPLRCLRTPHTLLRPTAFAIPTTPVQIRHASILGNLADVPTSYNKRIRRGRGASSGKGKTSGRGHKGQGQHGKVPFKFNGGQTKDEIVAGKRGFINTFSVEMTALNIDRVQAWIDQGRLDASRPITVKELHESRCTHGIKDGVKLLARNGDSFRQPINIIVSRASAAAISAIEAAGGSVTTRYYTRPSIRRILKGETHPVLSLLSPEVAATAATLQTPSSVVDSVTGAVETAAPIATAHQTPSGGILAHLPPMSAFRYRLPDPASRPDIEYYRDPAHRGYLSYTVAEGQGPSLFFKAPAAVLGGSVQAARKKKASGKAGAGAQSVGRIW